MTEPHRIPGLFVPLSVDFPVDPAIVDASLEAEHVYIRSLLLAKRLLNDGELTLGQLRKECDKLDRQAVEHAADELVELGLFATSTPGRYRVAGWAKWNMTAGERAASIEAKREAGRRGNHRRWHVDKGVTDSDCSYCAEQNPTSVASSQPRSGVRSHPYRKASLETEPETEPETEVTTPPNPPADCDAAAQDGEQGSGTVTATVVDELINATRRTHRVAKLTNRSEAKLRQALELCVERGHRTAPIRHHLATELPDDTRDVAAVLAERLRRYAATTPEPPHPLGDTPPFRAGDHDHPDQPVPPPPDIKAALTRRGLRIAPNPDSPEQTA